MLTEGYNNNSGCLYLQSEDKSTLQSQKFKKINSKLSFPGQTRTRCDSRKAAPAVSPQLSAG